MASTIEVQQFDSPTQETEYRALIQELRCPQCQNNNIADSNATIATDMRHKTLELLKQGKNKQEVVDYMIERYGNFVTYDPPITPATILLWLIPLLLIVIGGVFIWGRNKQHTHQAKKVDKPSPTLDQARLNKILNNKDKQ